MVSMGRIKERLKHLLAYFGTEYVKAYKTALVLHIRDQKNGAKPSLDKPEWKLMLDNSALAKNPRIEGDVYIGDGFKKKVHWSMGKNYVVTETPIAEEKSKEEKNKDGAVAPASPSSSTAEAASPTSASSSSGDASSSSTTEGEDAKDTRVWLDDSCAKACMMPECGEAFGLLKRRSHCRHCGEIFCKKHTSHKIGKDKFCDTCFALRSVEGSPESKMPVLEKPKIKVRMLNFYKYKCSLHDTELFAAAGAANAASKVQMPAGAEGKFLLVLTHKRSTRPQPTIAFDSKEERDKWKGLIESASWWSPAPITMDPILRKAFTTSYNKLRWHAWVWGSWDIDGSESEMLADVLYEVLEREIFGSELAKLGELPRKLARKAVIGTIEGAVSVAWTGIMKGLGAIRGPLEGAVGEMLGPLFETEKKVKDQIEKPIQEAATKGLESAEAKVQELFESNLPVIAAAGEAELNLIHTSLVEFLEEWEKEGRKDASNFNWKYGWVQWRGDWLYAFKQKPISEMIDAKLKGEDASAESHTLGSNLNNDMRDLNQSAFIVLRKAVTEKEDPSIMIQQMAAAYPDIMHRAAHDMTQILQWRLVQALDKTIRGPLLQVTNELIKKITAPLDSIIPSAIKDILDPARTCMEIIDAVLTTQEQALIRKAITRVNAGIIEQGNQLAAKGLKA